MQGCPTHLACSNVKEDPTCERDAGRGCAGLSAGSDDCEGCLEDARSPDRPDWGRPQVIGPEAMEEGGTRAPSRVRKNGPIEDALVQ